MGMLLLGKAVLMPGPKARSSITITFAEIGLFPATAGVGSGFQDKVHRMTPRQSFGCPPKRKKTAEHSSAHVFSGVRKSDRVGQGNRR